MYKNFDPHKPYFYAVAMALIVIGCLFVATSLVEAYLNYVWQSGYQEIFLKCIGGFIVIGLGYLHLELELIRVSRR